MVTDREELKRRVRERLGKAERKAPQRVSWKSVAKIIGLGVAFGVAWKVFAKLLPLIPGWGGLPSWVAFALPLALAWLVVAGLGANIVSGKQSLALATICLVVAAPLAWYKPWERGWQPARGDVPGAGHVEIPENVPENVVVFHFLASFTYDGGEGDPALPGFWVDLPMPHVAGFAPVGIPENRWDFNLPVLDNWTRHRPDIWRTDFEELGNNQASTLCWIRYAIYAGGELRWERRLENGLVSVTSAGPSRTVNLEVADPWKEENVMPKAMIEMGEQVNGVYTARDSLYPGETVLLEGVFLVHRDNAEQVRIGDLGPMSGPPEYVGYDGPWEENGPVVCHHWGGGYEIKGGYRIQLDKLEDDTWVTVEKFQEIRPGRKEVWLPGWTYVDRA